MRKTRNKTKTPFGLELKSVMFWGFEDAFTVTDNAPFRTTVELDIQIVGDSEVIIFWAVVANQWGIAEIPKPRRETLRGRTPIKVGGSMTSREIEGQLKRLVNECTGEHWEATHAQLSRYFRCEYDDRYPPITSEPNLP